MVRDILPGLRARVARKLTVDYGFSQSRAAKCMGTTQPAISQYKSELRGRGRDMFETNPFLAEAVEKLAKKAAEGSLSPEQMGSEVCGLCRALRDSMPAGAKRRGPKDGKSL